MSEVLVGLHALNLPFDIVVIGPRSHGSALFGALFYGFETV
jgi:hypothetical protein